MRLYEFIENLIVNAGYVSIYDDTDLIFHGTANDAYENSCLAEYWGRKILVIIPAYDNTKNIPYITVKLCFKK